MCYHGNTIRVLITPGLTRDVVGKLFFSEVVGGGVVPHVGRPAGIWESVVSGEGICVVSEDLVVFKDEGHRAILYDKQTNKSVILGQR